MRNKRLGTFIRIMFLSLLFGTALITINAMNYYSEVVKVQNFLYAKRFKVDLIDVFQRDQYTLPGDTINKDVSMQNNGDVDAVVRIKLTPSWNPETDLLGNPLDGTLVTTVFSDTTSTDWTFIDGYYYYNKILLPDETTTILVDALDFAAFSNDVHATDYTSAEFTLLVEADSLQANLNATKENWSMVYVIFNDSITWSQL